MKAKNKAYIKKFEMKMVGATEQTARGWVKGIDSSPKDTKLIWKVIKSKYY